MVLIKNIVMLAVVAIIVTMFFFFAQTQLTKREYIYHNKINSGETTSYPNASNIVYSSPGEAKELAIKAKEYILEHGKKKALDEFNKRESEFVKNDLYVFANDDKGVNLAHPIKPSMVGKKLTGVNDAMGVPITQRIMGIRSEGWIEYLWPHPITNKIEHKKTYIIKVDDIYIGVGVYINNSDKESP